MFTFEEGPQQLAALTAQAAAAGIQSLPLAVDPAAQPDAVRGLVDRGDIQTAVLGLVGKSQVIALLPEVVLLPHHAQLVQQSLALGGDPGAGTVGVQVGVALAGDPLAQQHAIRGDVLRRNIQVAMLVVVGGGDIVQ